MKIEDQTTTQIDVGKLMGSVGQFRSEGYRLVQINATKAGDLYEINYSFDKDYRFENIRITIPIETEVPSISGMYWGAFVYENEMHDLFGLQVKGINVDYKGNLIKTTIRFPFGPGAVTKEEKP